MTWKFQRGLDRVCMCVVNRHSLFSAGISYLNCLTYPLEIGCYAHDFYYCLRSLEFIGALSHFQAPLGLHTLSCHHMTGSLRETQRGILCLLMFSSFISFLSCHCMVKHIHKSSATVNSQMEIWLHCILSRSVI